MFLFGFGKGFGTGLTAVWTLWSEKEAIWIISVMKDLQEVEGIFSWPGCSASYVPSVDFVASLLSFFSRLCFLCVFTPSIVLYLVYHSACWTWSAQR